jgi:sulfatase modifying factor 1
LSVAALLAALWIVAPASLPAQGGAAATGSAAAPGQSAVRMIKVSDFPGIEFPEEIIRYDGMPMVLIPAGTFIRGSNDPAASGGDGDEKPAQQIYLPTFYIDKFEVTNANYRSFVNATNYGEAPFMRSSGFSDPTQPVVGVSWEDAMAYASWAGKRLPTEAEWEKAARGTDGRLFPWGNELKDREANTRLVKNRRPAPVGQFSTDSSPYGVKDMAGNVAEWVFDWYDAGYYAKAPASSPAGPDRGDRRGVRGGSWDYDPDKSRVISRNAEFPSEIGQILGFRCVFIPGTKSPTEQESAREVVSYSFDDQRGGNPPPAPVGGSNRGAAPSQDWAVFEEQFGRLFESHRPLVGNMAGEISRLYPAHDRRDVYFVNLTDRHFAISIVNQSQQALVYDETARVNSAHRVRLPIAKEKFRIYVIENDSTPTMEFLGDLTVTPDSRPLSIVFDLEGRYDSSKPRMREVQGKLVEKKRELALVNQTDKELVFVMTDMDEMRVYREYRVPPRSYIMEQPASGSYRVVAKYSENADLFEATDTFPFQTETVRQTIVGSPAAGGFVIEGFEPLEVTRSVYVPE